MAARKGYCWPPPEPFTGEHRLCARLRTADEEAAAGSHEEGGRMVGQIWHRWPKADIIVRADSGFCRKELMA